MSTAEDAGTYPQYDDRVLDVGAVKALAHPIRVAIYDILSQLGPQTASSLAERLGESSGATSYHLRALAKQDLIREVEGRGTARERWWERPPGGVIFRAPHAMPTPAGRAAAQVLMSALYERRHRQLVDFAMSEPATEPDEWRQAALLSTASARMTAEQLRDLSRRVRAVIDADVERYRDQQGEGVRPVTLRADLFPLDEESS